MCVGSKEGNFVKEDIVVVLNEAMVDAEPDAKLVVGVAEGIGEVSVA